MVESTSPIGPAGEYYSVARRDCSYNQVVICVTGVIYLGIRTVLKFCDEMKIPEFNVNHH